MVTVLCSATCECAPDVSGHKLLLDMILTLNTLSLGILCRYCKVESSIIIQRSLGFTESDFIAVQMSVVQSLSFDPPCS